MRKSQARHILRTHLADLFQDPNTIRVVVSDAELDPTTIDFNGSAVVVWQDVLIKAEAQRKLGQLITQARERFPTQADALAQEYQAYLTARSDPPSFRQWSLFIATILTVTLLVLLAWRYMTYIEPMSTAGAFNVAVAQMPIVTSGGQRSAECASEKISQWIYDAVIAQPNAAAQDLLTDSRSPREIGVIYVADPATHRAKAAKLAEKIQATILVYGVVTRDGDQYLLSPEFYVNPSESAFSYASEIAGANRLGEAVPFTLPAAPSCDTLNPEELQGDNFLLADRVQVLTMVVSGLRYLYGGEFDLAYAQFERGIRLSQASPTDKSYAVLYLLMGAAKLRSFEPTDPAPIAAHDLYLARTAFSQTIELDPDYSRGYLGLGHLALAEAQLYDQQGSPLPAVNPQQLLSASQWFTAALTATDQPVGANIAERAGLGIGTAHLLGFIYGISSWSESRALAEFQKIIALYEKERSPPLTLLAAQAHERMAYDAQFQADWPNMAEHCLAAIDLLEQPTIVSDNKWIARHWACVAVAAEKQGNPCQAVADYELALRYGSGLLSTQELERWRQESQRLQEEPQGAACNAK